MSKSDLDIMINLLANTKGMRKEYQQAITEQVALNKELTRGQSASAGQAAAFTLVEASVKKLDNHVQQLVNQQNRLNKEINESRQQSTTATAGITQYENALQEVERELRQVIAHQNNLNSTLRNTEVSGRAASRNIKDIETSSRGLGDAVRPLAGYMAGVFGVFAATNAAVNIKDTLADYQQFRTRLQYLSEDTRDYANSMAFLTTLAEEHGKSVLTMGESYASLAALRKGDIIDQQQQQQLMTGLSNAQSALGVSTDQLGNLMYGLGQALSQPNIQAQEFNQVMEPLPGLMQAMTRAAGLQGQTYRDLVLAGKVTSAMFRDDLIKALGEYDGAAKANINNITAQENALENLRVQTIAAFEEPINNVYGTLLETTADAMTFVRDNAETLTSAIETLTTVGLIRGVAAVTNYTTSLGKEAIAKNASAQATLIAAKRQHEYNLSVQAGAQRSLAVATSDTARAAALTRLAKANQAVVASQTAVNVATAQYAVVGRAATAVARGLWAAIGGIPGLILLGAYAVYEFASSTDEATSKTGDLKTETKDLASEINDLIAKYKQLDDAGKNIELKKLDAQELSARQKVLELENKIRETRDKYYQPGTVRYQEPAELVALRKSQAEFQKLADDTAKKKAELFNIDLSSVQWVKPDPVVEVNSELEKLLANLEKQRALYGETSEAAKVAYETTYGSLKSLTAEEKAQLILAASKLDAKKAEADANRTLQAEVDKLLEKHHEELELYGDTSREAQVRYDIEYGALKNVNDELKKKLILQAQELDNLAEAKTMQSKVERIAAATQTPTQRENSTYQENIITLETYRDSLPETDLTKRQEINQLIEAEQRRHDQVLREIEDSRKTDFDMMWQESFDRFAAGVGQATVSALDDSENLGDGLKNVITAVGKQSLATLVEIGVKEAGNFAMRALLRKSDLADDAATQTAGNALAVTTGVTTAAALTAAWTPAAAMVSLATMGANAAAASAGITSTMALTKGLGYAGMFDNGGRIPAGQFGIAGEFGPEIVRGPAYVTSRKDTASMLSSAQSQTSAGSTVVNYTDNSVTNISGGNTDEVVEKVRPMLKAQKEETLAEVGMQLKRGRGVVYDGLRASR
ncbi:tape measure protein [Alteromonas sp. RKMC-009]|uniref:tape measure protein n=1 Tax=Alteromonas sp. RKMC-009 TaxID=2267264 RepID=UPI000E6873B0|nr:tape measure protein [Alteromonas sp. RKMC-009]AYA63829.1 hypothetical protein DS731_07345 [Alteromonas sp. RKMC-009]